MQKSSQIRKKGVASLLVLLLVILGATAICGVVYISRTNNPTQQRASSSKVQVNKGASGWEFLVNERPFWIKGVGCNGDITTGLYGENCLRMAKEMGANAIRTWSTVPRTYLDKARSYGLMVHVSLWLNPISSVSTEGSYQDPAHCQGLASEIMDYVHRMKDHPALLTWGVGDEVLADSPDTAERGAFGQFLEGVVQRIHREDPNHPVVYASASTADLPELQAYVPSLDILGINDYGGGFSNDVRYAQSSRYDKPAIAMEFGPLSWTQAERDDNGMPLDPLDQNKAADYASLWREIEAERPKSFGGFAFLLGHQQNEKSLTWFNLNLDDLRREAYWTLYTIYTGRQPVKHAPIISAFQVDQSGGVPAGARFNVVVTASDLAQESLHYKYFVTDIVEDYDHVPPTYYPVDAKETFPGSASLKAPNNPGIYRVYVSVTDEHKNTAVANRSVRVPSVFTRLARPKSRSDRR